MADVDGSASAVTGASEGRGAEAPRPSAFRSYGPWFVVKWILLILFNGLVVAFIPRFIEEQSWLLLAYAVLVLVAVDLTYTFRERIPGKWLIPGTVFLLLFGVFPVFYTIYVSFTNQGTCGTCALLTQEQAVDRIVGQSVTPVPDAPTYRVSVFEGSDGFFFVLQEQGDDAAPYQVGTAEGLSPADESKIVVTGTKVTEYDGSTALNAGEINRRQDEIKQLQVPTGEPGQFLALQGISSATVVSQQFVVENGMITDTATGTTFEPVRGTYTATDGSGQTLTPSFQVGVGFDNYKELFTNDAVSEPFLRVFIWTMVFSTLTVASTFALGLLLAMLFNHERMRGKKIYRVLLIIPYALPTFMTILVWRGMLNESFGIVNRIMPFDVPWLTNANWAKFSVLLVNLWLGYAYMFLVTTGALQGIPTDLKEAAFVDGATGFRAFRKITFPLLLIAVAPVLIASFAFNFNNYNLIRLLTNGGPPISGSIAGETDIMLSYSTKVAFGGAGSNYGLATAISTTIFIIVALISLVGFRYTRSFEEVR